MVHRRLAIVDLSEQAKQPMTNKDNSIYVVFLMVKVYITIWN